MGGHQSLDVKDERIGSARGVIGVTGQPDEDNADEEREGRCEGAKRRRTGRKSKGKHEARAGSGGNDLGT